MKYTTEQRLKKILDKAEKLYQYIQENQIEKDDLLNDYSLQWLVTTPLYNIGEQVYHLSAEYKSQHQNIPWEMIAGLRHRLVHDYDGINWNVIVRVIYDELPKLIAQFKNLQ